MGVKVTFLGDEPKGAQESAARLLVPQAAVRSDSGSSIVYVYRDGQVERRAVRVGNERGSDREIIAGLAGGDQVVVSGFDGLRDGAHVALKR